MLLLLLPSTLLVPRACHVQGMEGAEGEVAAAEREWSDLQWRKFDVAARGASDSDRRTYRSLLFNLTTQRQLLRQVTAAG